LDAEPADAADADEHREVSFGEPAALDRLPRRGDRVGEHRELGEPDAAVPEGRRDVAREAGDFAESRRGHEDVRREPAVQVVAREDLCRADVPAAGAARAARAARDHRGHDDGLPRETADVVRGALDDAADLVSQGQGERVPRPHAVVPEGEVRVADAAPGDADEDVSRRRIVDRPLDAAHGLARGGHLERTDGRRHARQFTAPSKRPP
jgi:hypothetical protein